MPTPSTTGVISDFDQTISIRHTFATYQKGAETCRDKTRNALIEMGRELADVNAKSGFPEGFFRMDETGILMIATCHNNPDFVAGFVSKLMGKAIAPSDEMRVSEVDAGLAVKSYPIVGEERPLLIAHIQHTERHAFEASRHVLKNKNHFIQLLRKVALEKGLVGSDTTYDFFDDTKESVLAAGSLEGVRSHWVTGKERFAITAVDDEAALPQVPAFDPGAAAGGGGGGAESDTDRLIANAYRAIRATGVVYPSTLSRVDAEALSDSTGCAVIRESSSIRGMIAVTIPARKQGSEEIRMGKDRNLNIAPIVAEHHRRFRDSTAAKKSLVRFMHDNYKVGTMDHATGDKLVVDPSRHGLFSRADVRGATPATKAPLGHTS